MKRNIISLFITFIIGFISFYIFLPALNIHSLGFWIFVIYLIIIYSCIAFAASIKELLTTNIIKKNKTRFGFEFTLHLA